ncbi:hypothetical protein DFP73DRAFT_629520 [Morchella snyderi]|nr:hypothetical protein DFP73DRAFT_629520 [Morchella snyderi]
MGSCLSIRVRRRPRFEDVFPVILQELEHPAAQPDGDPAGQPGGNPAWQPGGNPAGQPGGDPAGNPGVDPAGQPGGDQAGQPGGEQAGQPGGDTAAPESSAAPGNTVESVVPSPPGLSGENPWDNGNPTDGTPGYYRGKDIRAKARRKKHYRQQRGGMDGEDGEASSGSAAVKDDGAAKVPLAEQGEASGVTDGSGKTQSGIDITGPENDVANPPAEHTSPAMTPVSSNEGTLSTGSWVNSDRTRHSPYFDRAQAELTRALTSGTGRASITVRPDPTIIRPDGKTRSILGHVEEGGELDQASAEDGPAGALEHGRSPSDDHDLTKQASSMESNSALDRGVGRSITGQSRTARPEEAVGDATAEGEPPSGYSSEINTSTEPVEALKEEGLKVTTQTQGDGEWVPEAEGPVVPEGA